MANKETQMSSNLSSKIIHWGLQAVMFLVGALVGWIIAGMVGCSVGLDPVGF